MNRILFDATEILSPLSLKDKRATHCIKILHKHVGESFEAGIINGNAGLATITSIDSNSLYFEFAADECKNIPLNPLSLIIGFPRPIQLRRLLRDCGSFGVHSIHLVGTQLGEKSYLKSNLMSNGSANEALLDGVIQSKGTHVPLLRVHNSLKECLEQLEFENTQCILLDTENTTTTAFELAKKGSLSDTFVYAAIGSERGWSTTERELFRSYPFTRCSLGQRILRTETATTATIALLLCAMASK
ncbi:MAG: RsmE family RNA methyltransferase [Treponemataceae bacterium]